MFNIFKKKEKLKEVQKEKPMYHVKIDGNYKTSSDERDKYLGYVVENLKETFPDIDFIVTELNIDVIRLN